MRLHDLSLDVSTEEFVSIIGRSGTGKPPCFEFLQVWNRTIRESVR